MGRKKRTDLPIPENEQLRYTEKEPLAAKIKKILTVLLIDDLEVTDEAVDWISPYTRADPTGRTAIDNQKCEIITIKKFEEFPYFLYKAVWDKDFEALQWGEHENGETILINYGLLQRYLSIYRPDGYKDDFSPEIDYSGNSGNRLHYNLATIFGFNRIEDNFESCRNLAEHMPLEFFEELDQICQRNSSKYGDPDGITSTCNRKTWVEYHHSDFFKVDTTLGEPPKRKNSKFFKICQTLKTGYRCRKPDGEPDGDRLHYNGNQVPVEDDRNNFPKRRRYNDIGSAAEYRYDGYNYYHDGYNYTDGDNLDGVQPSPEFSAIDQESLSRAQESESEILHMRDSSISDMFSVRSTAGSAIETN